MRETSIEAYKAIRSNGVLGERQLEALALLAVHGPITALDLNTIATAKGYTMGLWKRLSELKRLGYVREQGTKVDVISGRRSIVWEVIQQPKSEQLELV